MLARVKAKNKSSAFFMLLVLNNNIYLIKNRGSLGNHGSEKGH